MYEKHKVLNHPYHNIHLSFSKTQTWVQPVRESLHLVHVKEDEEDEEEEVEHTETYQRQEKVRDNLDK